MINMYKININRLLYYFYKFRIYEATLKKRKLITFYLVSQNLF